MTDHRRHSLRTSWSINALCFVLLACSPAVSGPATAGTPAPSAATAAQHTGPVLGEIIWETRTGGPVRSTPAVADGVVYVGSTDGHLYALDAGTGAVRWRYAAGSPLPSSPVLAHDRVYVQDRAGTLHAVRASDGQRAWLLEAGPQRDLPWGYEGWDYVLPAPAIDGDRLVHAGGNGTVYAVGRDGGVQWTYDTGARLRATPEVGGGTVYVGAGDGIFHAISSRDGSRLWTFRTQGAGTDAEETGFDRRQIHARARVVDGVVYFGSRDAQTYALDASSGEKLWNSNDGTSGWVIAGPAIDGDRLLETRSSSARIRSLVRADGSERWQAVTGGAIFGVPALYRGQAILGNGAGMLLGYDTDSGEQMWSYGLGSSVWAEPTLADDRLYVGADDGIVRAFRMRDGLDARMAVYWDDDYKHRTGLGNEPHHAAIAEYFAYRGYRRLDSDDLERFLRTRIEDGRASAVVFAMDALPDTARREDVLREYLRAGGKVVWLGSPPLLVARDDEGNVTAFDRAGPTEYLGVDHAALVGDQMPVFPTDAGRARGLESFWIGSPLIVPDDSTVVLARDGTGAAVAWQRPWSDRPEAGFVQLYPTTSSARLDEIRRVVEHGIFRSPTTRTVDAR